MQTNLQRGDIKYYYQIHCNKQKAKGNTPVNYASFTRRLKKMNLHDAIYMPRVEYNVKHRFENRNLIQDAIRRKQINKSENIQILDLDNLRKLEMNQIKMPKPRKTLFQRIREWIKQKLGN
jgi:hypothetical protein